jgi:hypothetical protein
MEKFLRQEKQLSEREIEPRSIAVVTGTYYPTWGTEKETGTDTVRGSLAIKTLKAAKERGYQIVIGDVGSSPEFLAKLRKEGIVSENKKGKTMSGARQETFEQASELGDAKVIVWTEAEKDSLIEDCLPDAVNPILDGRADIVIPKRGPDEWATYPAFQAEIEQKANKKWNEILRANGLLNEKEEDLDVWFGAKFFKNDPEILKMFTEKYTFDKRNIDLDKVVNPEMYSNALFFPVIRALAEGKRVMSVNVPYHNPVEQTNFEKDSSEFHRKRRVQYLDILTNTINFIRLLKENPKGRLRKAHG